jgi:hypothetical protein
MAALKKFEIFLSQHPDKIHQEFLPENTLKKIAKEIDEPYSEFLKEHGVAGYDNGFIWSVNPYDFTDLAAEWRLKKTDHIIARTAFGDMFVWTGKKVLMVQVNYNKISEYGGDSIARLYDISFINPRAKRTMLLNDIFDKAVKKLGVLKPGECYGFVPAIPLGGKEDVNNLQKVELIPYLEMLAQAQ